MSSDDDEFLSYTPLKRQKIGCGDSIRSSQLSYSHVQEHYKNKKLGRSSQTPKNQNTTISMKSSSSTINKKDLSFKKPFLSKESKNVQNSSISKYTDNNNISGSKFNSMNSISNSHSQSNSKLNKNNNNRYESNDSTKRDHNESKLKNTEESQVKNIFEDNTPDIDLTQVIQSVSSNSSDGETLLDESEVNHDILSRSQGIKKTHPDVCITSHSQAIKETHLDIRPSKFVNNNDDNDFVNVEDPVQTNLSRVDSWLQSSIEQGIISPKNVEYAINSTPSQNTQNNNSWANHTTENSHINSKANHPTESSNNPQGNSEETKMCVHLHFHVNSPKKFIQPTLEQFFTKSTGILTPKKTISESSTASRNGKDTLKAWNNIMNSKKQNNPGPSKASQTVETLTIAKKSAVNTSENKKCPFYKFVEDTSFVVDGFSYGHVNGVTAYFLSHFHADHYKGLSGKFKKPIYCTQITANLIRLLMKVEAKYIRPLPLEEPRIIDGVEVTLFDSNHCPGAVMFLFKLTTGKTLLHVGDFRAHPDMESINALWNSSINVLYLDTTYLDPCYDFLPQEVILEKCRSIAKEHHEFNKQTLFVVGSYKIGKEKVYKEIASELDCKIYVPPDKSRILHCLEDREITDRLTKNKLEARVHPISMWDLSPWKLKQYMEGVKSSFRVLVAIKPTGWEHNSSTEETLESITPKQIGNIYIYGVPYSEHSSYYELQRFVQFVQPGKIIPTVNNGNETARNKMMKTLNKWQDDARISFRKN